MSVNYAVVASRFFFFLVGAGGGGGLTVRAYICCYLLSHPEMCLASAVFFLTFLFAYVWKLVAKLPEKGQLGV